ncbi:MAG: ribosomal protein [Ignavibacteria bacterium]|nr:ribosomal protein [Ignavibacteria bacterium]
MSRIGKKPVQIPAQVQVTVDNHILKAKGPKGELSVNLPSELEYQLDSKVLTFSRSVNDKNIRALHGLTRSLVANAVEGVSGGFTRQLKIEGVGYKVEMRGKRLLLAMGFSHPIVVIPPDGITLEAPNPNTIIITGSDKQLLGQVAAKIRSIRPPEPYKGKGIRYDGEFVRRKAGKTSSK